MATTQKTQSADAFADEVFGLLNDERVFEVRGKKFLLEEPTGAECEDAVKTSRKLFVSTSSKKLTGKALEEQADSLVAWKRQLVKRVLPVAVFDRVGQGGVDRFVAATGGWNSPLVVAAMRLHGISVPKKDGAEEDGAGDPGNPT